MGGDDRRIRLSINSKTWDLRVNVVAASHLIPHAKRLAMLRRCGLEIGDATVFPAAISGHSSAGRRPEPAQSVAQVTSQARAGRSLWAC